jgi:hypothetical protein
MCSPRLESERHMARPQGVSAGAARNTGNQCIRFELRVYRTVEVCSIVTVCVLLVYVHGAGVPPGNSRLDLNPSRCLRRDCAGWHVEGETTIAPEAPLAACASSLFSLPNRFLIGTNSESPRRMESLLALVRPRFQGRAGSCTGESSTVYWCGASTGNALPSTLRIRRRATYRSSSGRRQSRRPDGA